MIPWIFVSMLLLGMSIHIGLGLYSRRFKGQDVQLPFELLMYFCAVWTATFALDIASDSLEFKILLMKIRLLFIPFIPLCLMLIAIIFSGHRTWITRRRLFMLLIIPTITTILAITTEHSTIYRYDFSLVQTSVGFSVLGFTEGIWSVAVYRPFIFIEEAITLFLLLQLIFWGHVLFSRQAALFLIAVTIPVCLDVLFLIGISPIKNYNIVPSTFAFTGILLSVALFRYRFVDIVPIARNRLFEQMRDPMLVIDGDGRLADFNPQAEAVLGLRRREDIGFSAAESMQGHPNILSFIKEGKSSNETFSIGSGAKAKVFEISIEALSPGGARSPEKLVLLHDITSRKRAEEKAAHLASFPQLTPLLILEVATNGSILYANPSLLRSLELMRESDPTIFIPSDIKERLNGDAIVTSIHEIRDIEINGRSFSENIFFTPEFSSLRIYASDITDYIRMKRDEAKHSLQNQMLLELHLRAHEPKSAIMDYILDAITKLTQSRYSWFGLMDDGESVMNIHRWSSDAMKECTIAQKSLRYPVIDAGLWGESIRQRKPLMINDYELSHPGKRGIPQGHVAIKRLLVVPVIDGGRIVAAAAVSNKEEDYVQSDLDALAALMQKLWEILKRKQAEEALQMSEEKFKKAFFTNSDSISINRLSDGMFVSVNRGFEKISGYTEAEVVGKTSLQINLWKNPQDRMNIVEELQSKGEVRDYEAAFLTRRGEITGLMSASIIELDGVPHILNITRDITDRKKAELALSHSHDLMRYIIEHNRSAVAVHDRDLKYIYVSQRYLHDYRVKESDVIGMHHYDVFPDLPQKWRDVHQKALQGVISSAEDDPYYRDDGTVDWTRWECRPWYESDGSIGGIIVYTEMITDRKRAERELADYAKRLAIINRADRIISSSLDIDQVYDRFVAIVKEIVSIDRTSVVLLDDSKENWTVSMMWTGYEPVLRQGDVGAVSGSAVELAVKGKQPFWEDEIGEKGCWSEVDALRNEGVRSRLLLPLIIRDEVIGVLSFASKKPSAYAKKDIEILTLLADQFSLALQNSRLYEQVKRQSVELEQTVQERTKQLQKANMELEAFSYSVSHDLRAPLRAVDGFSRILLEEHHSELSPDAQHYLNLVRSNAVQMGQLIDDLLTFSRTSRQVLSKRPMNPADVVAKVLDELKGEIGDRDVKVMIGGLPECLADPAMLKRVFFNLISNAVKFTRKKKKKKEARIEIGSVINEGEVAYFIKDNGVGFDMRYYSKLFGVFSRLHSEKDYEGTGVGLALVQRIVHRHGGRVWAEAELGNGATFYFTLDGGTSQ